MDYLGGPHVITRVLKRKEGGKRVRDVTTEAEAGMMRFEDEGRSHEPRNICDF